ncbi:MAG: hypothetical protein PHF35_03930 [Candidatus Moranbacteria bacterium]|nr:hypothetical protein [Candidatus Moranbacteria bacterium]
MKIAKPDARVRGLCGGFIRTPGKKTRQKEKGCLFDFLEVRYLPIDTDFDVKCDICGRMATLIATFCLKKIFCCENCKKAAREKIMD